MRSIHALSMLLMAGGVGIILYGGSTQAAPGGSTQQPKALKITTSVNASTHVTANRLTVRLLARVENANAGTAQKIVEREVGKALKALPKGVHASTAGYRIRQRHPNGKPSSWQVSEILELRGAKSPVKLLADAQKAASSGLVIAAIDYSLSRHERDRVNMRLAHVAVRRWRKKASAMAHALGCKSIQPVHISTGSTHTRPQGYMMAAANTQNSAPPSRETLSVTVSGTARALGCH